jgi:hypothetical protein
MGKNEKSDELKPRVFRLSDATMDDLDFIARQQAEATSVPHSRTDALRLAVRREADRLRSKKSRE